MEKFVNTVKCSNLLHNARFTELASIKSDYSNWVIPKRIMCGPCPGKTSYYQIVPQTDIELKKVIDDIICDGIDTFICLQKEIDPISSYGMYIGQRARIIHYPIIDDTVPSIHDFLNHLIDICTLLNEGRNIYIHCAGGHGRTSLYAAAILAIYYKEMRSYDKLIYYIQSTHNMRRIQRNQFFGILPCMMCTSKVQRDLLKTFLLILQNIPDI